MDSSSCTRARVREKWQLPENGHFVTSICQIMLDIQAECASAGPPLFHSEVSLFITLRMQCTAQDATAHSSTRPSLSARWERSRNSRRWICTKRYQSKLAVRQCSVSLFCPYELPTVSAATKQQTTGPGDCTMINSTCIGRNFDSNEHSSWHSGDPVCTPNQTVLLVPKTLSCLTARRGAHVYATQSIIPHLLLQQGLDGSHHIGSSNINWCSSHHVAPANFGEHGLPATRVSRNVSQLYGNRFLVHTSQS